MPTSNPIHDDHLAAYLGIELFEVSTGHAKARVAIQDHHRNGLGMVHGGVLFSLADVAFAAACNTHGVPTVAINVSISFFRAPKGRTLYAEATEPHSARIAPCEVRITDEDGTLVALFHGLSYQKQPKPVG